MPSNKNLEINIKAQVENANSLKSLSDVLKEIARAMKDIKGAGASSSAMMEKYTSAALDATKKLEQLNTVKKKQAQTSKEVVKGSYQEIQELRKLQKTVKFGSAEFQKYEARIKELGREMRIAKGNTGIFNASTMNLLKNISAIGIGIGQVITKLMQFGKTVVSIMTDLITTAARTETLGVVVQQVGKNAGYSSSEIDGYVNSVKEMGITTGAARESITRMIQAKLNLADAEKLARISQDAAVIGNMNSSEAMEQLIYGIQTHNKVVLKTMGLVIDMEGSYKDYAKTMKIVGRELTEDEKTQAVLNAVMERGVDIAGSYEAAMGTAGKKIKSFERYIEEVKNILGGVFLPIVVVAIDTITLLTKTFINTIDVIKEISAEWNKLTDKIELGNLAYGELLETLDILIKEGLLWFKDALRDLKPEIEKVIKWTDELVKSLGGGGESGLLTILRIIVKFILANVLIAIWAFNRAMGVIVKTVQVVVNLFKKFKNALDSIRNALASRPSNVLFAAIGSFINAAIAPLKYLLGLLENFGLKFDYGQAERVAPPAIRPEEITGTTPLKKGDGTTGKEKVEDAKQELDLVKLNLLEQDKINTQILANVGNVGALIELQKQLNELKEREFFLTQGIQKDWLKNLANQIQLLKERESLEQAKGVRGERAGSFGIAGITPEEFGLFSLEVMEDINSVASSISNVFRNLMDAMNLGAHTFIGKLVSGFDTILSIIQTMISVMQAVDIIKGFIGMIIPGGGALPGLGGMPAGPTGMVGGMSNQSIINNIMNTTTNNNARIIEVPYIATTNIEGKSIKLVLERVNKSDNFRSGDV